MAETETDGRLKVKDLIKRLQDQDLESFVWVTDSKRLLVRDTDDIFDVALYLMPQDNEEKGKWVGGIQ